MIVITVTIITLSLKIKKDANYFEYILIISEHNGGIFSLNIPGYASIFNMT